jgi:hypothetical protein
MTRVIWREMSLTPRRPDTIPEHETRYHPKA